MPGRTGHPHGSVIHIREEDSGRWEKEATMSKWEYCKLVWPVVVAGSDEERGGGLKFLGSSEEDTRSREIDRLDRELAVLGTEGWELVTHMMRWAFVGDNETLRGAPAPILEVFHLKRQAED